MPLMLMLGREGMTGGLPRATGWGHVSMQATLWRAIAVFRFASLVYAAYLLVQLRHYYVHWVWGWALLVAGGPSACCSQAVEIEAASRERERPARSIHDSVLQVLVLAQRKGAETGGEAAEIGRLVGTQEAALRALMSDGPQRPRRARRTSSRCSARRSPPGWSR
jgi:signal transduction histidine kinase